MNVDIPTNLLTNGHRRDDHHSDGDIDDDDDDNDNDTTTPPLEQRIVEVVKGCRKIEIETFGGGIGSSSTGSSGGHDDDDDAGGGGQDASRRRYFYYEVKPSTVSAELGLSIEDSTAELCGLLQAVGGGHDGASFVFQTTSTNQGGHVADTDTAATAASASVSTMVFHFPVDFERRAKTFRRKEDFNVWARQSLQTSWKIVKVVTAFGLILSLFILTIAALVGLVAAIVAMSTNNQHQHRGSSNGRAVLVRQVRTLFYTLRQLLWCYALYGDHDGRDPFLSEMAYDSSLCLSICCGSPGSLFWWIRVHQLNRRRRHRQRGWGRRFMSWNHDESTTNITTTTTSATNNGELHTDVEGVRLIRRGEWGQATQEESSPTTVSTREEHRGLLSIAVEYLFGPTPFHPGPTEAEKWKLRAAALVQLLAVNMSLDKVGVSLLELTPYLDSPPSSLDSDFDQIVAGGLQIVSHFNGVPAPSSTNTSTAALKLRPEPHLARFYFPELASEGRYATLYERPDDHEDDDDDEDEGGSWKSILCRDTSPTETRRLATKRSRDTRSESDVPTVMIERRYKFTNLQTDHFLYCVFLGLLNLVGVIWLRASLEPNGVLHIEDGSFGASMLKKGLMPVLSFYSVLFFVLPLGRLLVIISLNRRRRVRNQLRKALTLALSS